MRDTNWPEKAAAISSPANSAFLSLFHQLGGYSGTDPERSLRNHSNAITADDLEQTSRKVQSKDIFVLPECGNGF